MNLDSFQTEVLEVGQSAHNYRKWLSRLTFPYLGDNPLELGSGLGDYAHEWLRLGATRLTLSENSPTRVVTLTQAFQNDNHVKVLLLDAEKQLGSCGNNYSCVVSLNVLEHIEDDVATIKAAHCALRMGGYLWHLFLQVVSSLVNLTNKSGTTADIQSVFCNSASHLLDLNLSGYST